MRASGPQLVLPGTLALAGLPAPAASQPVGSEFQINTWTTNSQFTNSLGCRRSVAADASANFVVVWTSNLQDGDRYGIFGQRYDSTGEAQGPEFQANSYTTLGQRWPSVAAAADGGFVVVWASHSQDGHLFGVFGQRYDSAGGALGSEFRVNSNTPWDQSLPCVASDADGNFVVVWESQNQNPDHNRGIFGQRYDSAGVARGGEFLVNSYTTDNQQYPSIASDADGNFVVVWTSQSQDGSDLGIFGQRYDSAGVARGTEFRVNSYTPNRQWRPSVASAPSGNFVVVWESYQDGGSGTFGQRGIFGQRYDTGGVAQGGEFRVNSYA